MLALICADMPRLANLGMLPEVIPQFEPLFTLITLRNRFPVDSFLHIMVCSNAFELAEPVLDAEVSEPARKPIQVHEVDLGMPVFRSFE